MNKVICDICGTSYPSSAQKCPICGSSREYALENTADNSDRADFMAEEEFNAVPSRKKNKEIFDFDEVNQVKSSGKKLDEEDFDDEEEYEEESRTNLGLVIVLVVLIVLLLLAAGFFFLRYLLPNMTETPEEPTIVTTLPEQTEPVETGIPCTNLSIDGGKMELGKDGMKLLNVRVYPENTTDAITMVSGDESIVTVSEDGTVTAVGEGQTVITITCGVQQINCNVTVDYSIGQETVPSESLPGMEVEGSNPADETAETTEATQAAETTEATLSADQVLKLKKDDITISSNYTSVQLELEGDVDPENLSWFTMDSTVAIVHGGLVTSTGSGLTRIYGEYNGQQVMCIVRCVF